MSDQTKEQEHKGWIGVDLDGTLAHYDGWKGPEHIGEPVPEMLRKVKAWLAAGKEVRIFTARVWHDGNAERYASAALSRLAIEKWVEKHLGVQLSITSEKDYGMVELYDDRCVYVFPNSGVTHQEHQGALQAALYQVALSFGVQVKQGASFKDVAGEIAERSVAMRPKADKVDAALALVDGAADAISYVDVPTSRRSDLARAKSNLERALTILRELAGKGGAK